VPVTPPPEAVIVSVYRFASAPDPTAISSAEVPAPGAGIVLGLKLAVISFPKPDTDSVTAESKPPETVVVILNVEVLPTSIPLAVGETETLIAGISAITVRVNVVVCTMLPDVPVIVIGYVPGVVVTPTATVIKVAPFPPVIVLGLKVTVTPAGWPLAVSVMVPVKSPVGVAIISGVKVVPCCAV